MTIGLRPMKPADWIEYQPDFDFQLCEKFRLLDSHDDVVAMLPETERSQQEVLERLASHVVDLFPRHYSRTGKDVVVHATGETISLESDSCPIARAGRLVPEDLCLMRNVSTCYGQLVQR